MATFNFGGDSGYKGSDLPTGVQSVPKLSLGIPFRKIFSGIGNGIKRVLNSPVPQVGRPLEDIPSPASGNLGQNLLDIGKNMAGVSTPAPSTPQSPAPNKALNAWTGSAGVAPQNSGRNFASNLPANINTNIPDQSFNPNIAAGNPGSPWSTGFQGASQDLESANLTGYQSAQVTPEPASAGLPLQQLQASNSSTSDTNQTTQAPTTYQDLQSKIQQNIQNQDSFLKNLQQYVQPDPNLTGALGNYTNLSNDYLQGENAILRKPIPLEFQQGQQAAMTRDIGPQLQAYSNIIQNLTANRQQKMEAAQTLYNAYSTSLNNQVALLDKLSPQNLGIQHNDNTGDTYITIKDPMTGKISQQYLGNTGAGAKNLTSQIIGQHFDTNTGQMVNDYGVISAGADGIPQVVPIMGSQSQAYGIQGGSQDYQVNIPAQTLAGQNNNPGNLRYVGQPGASQGVGGFARFESPQAGFKALVDQIALDSSRGLNLGQFINKYAPPSENNTPQYLQQMMASTGAQADTPLSKIPLNTLAVAMAKKESGTSVTTAPQAQQTAAQGNGQPYQPGIGASQYDNLAQLKAQFPTASGGALRTTVDGTPYLIKDYIPSQQLIVTGNIAGRNNIPILDSNDASAVKNLDVTRQNLDKIQSLVKQINPRNALTRDTLGAAWNKISKSLQLNPDISSFNSWRDTAINVIQGLAGGSGSGFRLNQAEINTATNNIPTIYDTQATAQKKLDVVNSLMQTKLAEWLPNYQQQSTGNQQSNSGALQLNGQTYLQGPDGLYYAQ